MHCRICSTKMNTLSKIDNCVIGHSTLRDKVFEMPVCEVELFVCPNCFHMQIENMIEEDYYDIYECNNEDTTMYYSQTDSVYLKRIEKLKKYGAEGNSFLEIGCGNGYLLNLAKQYYEDVLGVEPSKSECEIASRRGLNVINTYFDKDLRIEKTYDAFASFMVFEHLEKPMEVLGKAFDILKSGGVGLINIPDGEKIVKRGLYHQFLTEHINYYSMLSVCKLIQSSGFEVLEIDRDDQFLEFNIYIRKPKSDIDIGKIVKEHEKAIIDYVGDRKNILVWGAGNKSNSYSKLMKKLPIVGIVDSDAKKTDLYVSNIDKRIELPSKAIVNKSDVIIIFASSYNKEIINVY